MNDYDMTIHTNPDARAWAKFFTEKYKVWSEDGVESDSEALMTAWFANAMMAMHDHLVLKGNPINGDHAQYLIDKENGVDMNARIKELWEQCKTSNWTYDNQTYDHEEFAELILADIDKLIDVAYISYPLHQAVVCLDIDFLIKQHFYGTTDETSNV